MTYKGGVERPAATGAPSREKSRSGGSARVPRERIDEALRCVGGRTEARTPGRVGSSLLGGPDGTRRSACAAGGSGARTEQAPALRTLLSLAEPKVVSGTECDDEDRCQRSPTGESAAAGERQGRSGRGDELDLVAGAPVDVDLHSVAAFRHGEGHRLPAAQRANRCVIDADVVRAKAIAVVGRPLDGRLGYGCHLMRRRYRGGRAASRARRTLKPTDGTHAWIRPSRCPQRTRGDRHEGPAGPLWLLPRTMPDMRCLLRPTEKAPKLVD